MRPLLGIWRPAGDLSDIADRHYVASKTCLTASGDAYLLRYEPKFVQVPKSDNASCLVEMSIAGVPDEWDLRIVIDARRLTIERDAFGRAPLYFTKRDGTVYFSTHVDALLPFVSSPSVSANAFHSYCSFSFVPAPLSPLDEIHSLAAGAHATWSTIAVTPSIEFTTNWPQPDVQIRDEGVAVAALSEQIELAIESQLRALKSEHVGVFLSGGLDSAITAAALVRAGLRVTAYSLDFGPHGISELNAAQEVSQHLRIPIKTVRVLPRDIEQAFAATVIALDSPFGDGVTVPLWLLNRAAACDGQEVVFNGEGGDQLFGGWTNKPLIASRVYTDESSTNQSAGLTDTYLRTFHRLHGCENLVFQPTYQKLAAEHDLGSYLQDALSKSEVVPLLSFLRRANLMLKGAQNIQPRATNLSVYHGLNLRSIFCHRPLADWTFSVQPELILRGACEKYILKKAVESWLPDSIIYREKRGMGVPLTEWCSGPLWGFVGSYLNSKRLSSTGYWQPEVATKLILGEVSAQYFGRRIGEILWLILMWEAWLEKIGAQAASRNRYNAFWPPVPLLRLLRDAAKV